MTPTFGLSWPAVLSTLAGVGYLALVWATWPFRDRPGARWWCGVLGAGALWALSYGVALTVFDPELRRLFEVPLWLGRGPAAAFILAFALGYTGRDRLVRSRWMGAVFAFFGVATLLYVSTPVTGMMWSGYEVVPVFGAAAVVYEPSPLLYVVTGVAYLTNGVSVALLLGSSLGGGRHYRRQVVALSLVIALPTAASLLWLLRLGPTAHLDLTPITFLPGALAVTYAMLREEMFDVVPATRRRADRVAIDDINTAVVAVTPAGRVVELNRTAADLFGVDRTAALRRPLSAFLDAEVPLDPGDYSLSNPAGRGREFRVDVAPVDDAAHREAGYTVTLQDVTEERLRRQRLAVLNRVLRHNLRNDMNVIRGNAQLARDRIAGTPVADEADPPLATVVETAGELTRTGSKAYEAETALRGSDDRRTTIDLERFLGDVLSTVGDRFPEADLDLSVPAGASVRADPSLLQLVVENVVENAVVHDDAAHPRVAVSVHGRDDGVTVAVADEAGGIPDHELSVVERGREDPLDHGSGLGLWTVTWGARALGGDVDFDVRDGGTTVRLRLADGDEPARDPVPA